MRPLSGPSRWLSPPSLLHTLGALPRRMRWRLQRWSAPSDREFHDALFGSQQYEPFTFAYPGYITIRRFAELAAAKLTDVRHALDVGCGTGEITCELARMRPDVAFTGVDHSDVAIARARGHAERLGLSNVTFEQRDMARAAADTSADFVLMMDSFHHLLDPAAFVRSLPGDRLLLIEPSGDWLGGWQKTLDLDWIAVTLDTMRNRMLWQIGEQPPSRHSPAPSASLTGAPVEHRYPLSDFRAFFAGFGLEARGTIAGLEAYPPDAYGSPPLRDAFGRITYDALVSIEEVLVRENIDLYAKHWVVHAERGAPDRLRQPRAIDARTGEGPLALQGPYDVEFLSCDCPRETTARATLLTAVTFRNYGWRAWTTDDAAAPVLMSYHWLDRWGALALEDGLRTALPKPVPPGSTCTMTCRVETPPEPGRYTLVFDLVEEGRTWFSRAGARTLQIPVIVRPPGR